MLVFNAGRLGDSMALHHCQICVNQDKIKTNRSFREENNQRFIENARRFFETNRMPDGAFFESEEIKKASKFSNLLSWFLLLLIVAIGLTFIFINNFSRQMGYLGLVLVIISAVSFIAWVIKKIRLADKQVSRPGAKFRLYQDRFIILPENITLRFKDVEAIDFNNSVDLFKANIIFHHTDHYFTLYSGGYTILVNSNRYKAALDLPYFLEHLGFVKHQGVQKKRYIYQKF